MPRVKYSNYSWTDKEVAKLIKLWPNHTAAEIAIKLNKTRAAVLGKVKRYGLKK